MKMSVNQWFKSGAPWVWLTAAAVAINVIMVAGLIILIAARGLGHFWPADILEADFLQGNGKHVVIAGELVESEQVSTEQLRDAGMTIGSNQEFITRDLMKIGNRDVTGLDFTWVLANRMENVRYPSEIFAAERREWGNFYGYLRAIKQDGQEVGRHSAGASIESYNRLWEDLQTRIERSLDIYEKIKDIEKGEIGSINYNIERLRLKQRGYELDNKLTPQVLADLDAQRAENNARYKVLQKELLDLYNLANRDTIEVETADGKTLDIAVSKLVHAYRPNDMGVGQKMLFYFDKLGEFLTEDPREANTEGGVFPAIFGTVMMVLLMSVLVTPFGVVAAVYLREYAKQGAATRLIRIAVNNLAGVPSIVYGVFGLGFFIYFLGGNIDALFFPESAPAPTFGTPGLMWASLTLALLTVPVVIVATEEGLSRIPRAVREGSLALGATKAETLWKIVLPMSSPAIMTGVILAVARAAGEVAPLMLVGVVKLAPSLPVDGNFPYFHLDQKFMHLGFHIYDVGFQSPNVEAARPLVYATALLLVVVIALLNISAVTLRNHLREKYKALEH